MSHSSFLVLIFVNLKFPLQLMTKSVKMYMTSFWNLSCALPSLTCGALGSGKPVADAISVTTRSATSRTVDEVSVGERQHDELDRCGANARAIRRPAHGRSATHRPR